MFLFQVTHWQSPHFHAYFPAASSYPAIVGEILNTGIACLGFNWVSPRWHRYCGVNPLAPNDPYRGRTAPLTSKRCILYIYSTNIGTEYFKHGIYSPFFSSSKCSLFQNSNVFGSCINHILYTVCAKIKKKIQRPKVHRNAKLQRNT